MTKKNVAKQLQTVAQQNHRTQHATVQPAAIAKQTARVTVQVNVAKVVIVNCKN